VYTYIGRHIYIYIYMYIGRHNKQYFIGRHIQTHISLYIYIYRKTLALTYQTHPEIQYDYVEFVLSFVINSTQTQQDILSLC